ncbi:MAG TPA: alpha/beta hydrolase [Candidatus Angelobacter sp.]|nr:alpha/beta hydrolase [Candidatus Angelobacter sp.]
MLPDPLDVVRAEGPWTHRDVVANACRFHVVEAGDGPLVVLLHGFPTFWWSWRHQLRSLAGSGYRAVAVDIRGYGGSDHTPHGYDPLNLAADLAGIVRTLGEPSAVVVGHGLGALVGWTAAAQEPSVVRGLVAVGMPHPVPLRRAFLSDPRQRRLGRYTLGLQRPFVPERQLVRDDAALVEAYLRRWSGSAWPDRETADVYRAAMLVPNTAHCSIEFHRWAIRSVPRRDGRRFRAAVADPVGSPVLQVHGRSDGAVLPSSVDGSEEYAGAGYTRVDLEGVGHFPHEEDPVAFDAALLPWIETLPRT